jgi:excisionase family DNA binding protein
MEKEMSGQEGHVETANGTVHIKIPEVCKVLGLSRSAVYALMERGELSFAKFGDTRRVSKQALDEYIKRSTTPARVCQ